MAYHTLLKDAVRLGKCPTHLLQQIPKQTISRWKYEASDKYFGRELNDLEKYIQLLEVMDQHRSLFYTYARLVNTFTTIFYEEKDYFCHLRKHRGSIVKAIENAKNTIGLHKALKLFRISFHTYKEWRLQVRFACNHSPSKLCKKRRPNQLTNEEVAAMETLLTDSDKAYWSIVSIGLWARRTGKVYASIHTWYKYNRLFGWRKARLKFIRKRHQGLRAIRPDQYWHADVTQYQTEDGVKAYIYLVMDNFSRKILSWSVSKKLSSEVTLETLKTAYENKVSKDVETTLVVDGGTENNNRLVDCFLKQHGIKKLVALKDFTFSNSMIEAFNKQLKYGSLCQKLTSKFKQLVTAGQLSIEEHNYDKPPAMLYGYTPDEVYHGALSFVTNPFYYQMQEARKHRVLVNSESYCGKC